MRFTAFFGAGLGLLLLQSNLFRAIVVAERVLSSLLLWLHVSDHEVHVPGFVPELVLPLVIYMGVHEYSLARGAAVAFALGYFTDLVGIAPVGLYTFTYVATFVLARAAGVRFAAQTRWMQVVLALVFSLVHSLMVVILVAIFWKERDGWMPRMIAPMALPHVLATSMTAPIVFRLAQRIHVGTQNALREGAPP